MNAALLAAALAACGCAATCPSGSRSDAARTARLDALISSDAPTVGAPICYAPGIGRGVSTATHIALDAVATDAELAGQLAHLRVHVRDRLGDGCGAGLAAALRSEREASSIEQRVRARLGLPPRDTETGAEDDYQRRCRR